MTTGLEMFSGKRLQFVKETTPGVLDPSATPIQTQSLKATYKNNPTFDKGMPSGFNAASWAALIAESVGLDNEWKPDYNELNLIFSMLCGDPVIDTNTAQQVTNTYGLALSGARDINTYSAQFGIPDQAEQMLYSLLQTLDMTVTRGESPFIDGSANMLFLKPGREDVRMSGGTNEEQAITLTGTAASGVWEYAFDGKTVAAIPFDVTAEELQVLFDDEFDEGNIFVTGGPLATGPFATVMAGRYASKSQALATVVDSGLTGSTPALAVSETTDGAVGTFPLTAGMPLLPQHFSVRRATTLIGLDTALPLNGVHKIAESHSGLADGFMFFKEGSITFDDHVDGGEPTHTITVSMANKITGDCQQLKDDARKSPSQPSWWEIRAAHPDGVTEYKAQFYGAIGEPIEKSAVGNVYAVDFPLIVLVNDSLIVDGNAAMMRFIVTNKVP